MMSERSWRPIGYKENLIFLIGLNFSPPRISVKKGVF